MTVPTAADAIDIARHCLELAHGEPVYAVLLIFDHLDDDHERRRALNRLWRIMEK